MMLIKYQDISPKILLRECMLPCQLTHLEVALNPFLSCSDTFSNQGLNTLDISLAETVQFICTGL